MGEKSIGEVIKCLQTYVNHVSPPEWEELVNNTAGVEEGTLLSLLAETLKSKNRGEELNESDILEIVFKCMLFSLNKSEKGVKEEEKISKFFHDIYQLIGEKNRNSTSINRLAEIFCENLGQIESHLSETFIVTNETQIISFR
jgi:hypothetical protein